MFEWIAANQEFAITIIVLVVGLLRATAWGRANAEALDAVTEAVERQRGKTAEDVKAQVKDIEFNLKPAAKKALKDSVNKADALKITKKIGRRFIKHLIGI